MSFPGARARAEDYPERSTPKYCISCAVHIMIHAYRGNTYISGNIPLCGTGYRPFFGCRDGEFG